MDAYSFGPDRTRTLVSLATDSPHMVIVGKCCGHSSSLNFDRNVLFLQVMSLTIIFQLSSILG